MTDGAAGAHVAAAPVVVRPAGPADAAAILQFVRELAEYEKLTHLMRATEADFARDLFGANPRVFCDIAELDGEPVGFALWFYTYSTFAGAHGIFLEDLFVRPAARGSGAGFALMRALARRCAREKLMRIEWAVLDWNSLALRFYDRLGAEPLTGWLARRLEGEALVGLGQD